MKFTEKELGQMILVELEKGFDIVRLSQAALSKQQEYGHDFTDEIAETVQRLMAMEEGAEFELSENELRELANELVGDKR